MLDNKIFDFRDHEKTLNIGTIWRGAAHRVLITLENYNMQYCAYQNYRLSTDVFLSTHNTTDIDRNVGYSSFNIFWFAAPCKPAGVSKTSMFQQKSLWCHGIGLSWTLDLWELWDCFVQTLKLFDVILISPIYISQSPVCARFMVMTKVIICFLSDTNNSRTILYIALAGKLL